jgi:DnaK suppressor protein
MDRDKLKLMDAALERLDYDEFGICDDCGETIPRKRLEAIPWAAYCLSCQERIADSAIDLNRGQLQLAA